MTNRATVFRNGSVALTASLTSAVFLMGCNSESAPFWELVDPGGGGAAPAIYAVPESNHLFVGSDVGGVRYSANVGDDFRVINEGLDFTNAASDNFQDFAGYQQGGVQHIVGSATAGLLYWRTIGVDGLAPSWQKFFDARGSDRNGATALGALAVDDAGEFLYAGVGNSNNLSLNRLLRVDAGIRGKIFYFRTADGTGKSAPPESAGSLSLRALCNDIDVGPYHHVSDLAAVDINGTEYLYVGTTEGLLIVSEPRSTVPRCARIAVPGRNPHVLSVQPSSVDARDVVLLLNEGGMERRNADRREQHLTLSKGGVFHTTDITAAVPDWENITPAAAQGMGLGGLERSRRQPLQLVLSGDAQSTLDLLFTPDLTADRWTGILDHNFFSRRSRIGSRDGWRRAPRSYRGTKEVAIAEDPSGILRIYVSGFQGRLLAGQRHGRQFQFDQSYTRMTGTESARTYRNRGVPLMNPWRSFADPRIAGRSYFLYHDNLMFVSDDAGDSFRRPVEQFGWGTDVVFDPKSDRTYISWSRGNHLESGRRQKAESGGLLVATRRAERWSEVRPALPARGPVEALALVQGQLCANVYRNGVFCSRLGRSVAWRRVSPVTLDILHLLEADDGTAIWVVAVDGDAYQLCRLMGEASQCNSLPATAKQFNRLWIDGGQLWLAARNGITFTSPLALPLEWSRIAAEISDLRSVAVGADRFSLIAGGEAGLFVSRTPSAPDSWCELPVEGLHGNRVFRHIAGPAGGEFVYVAAAGVGFYRASLTSLYEAASGPDCAP